LHGGEGNGSIVADTVGGIGDKTIGMHDGTLGFFDN
jgi:hypothetical protein